MKHGGPGATAVVGVHYTDSELAIEVTDDGGRRIPGGRPRWPAAIDAERAAGSGPGGGVHGVSGDAPGGHGLAGMKARASMMGGELAAGPRNSTGFCVRARLPVAGSVPPARGDGPRPLSGAKPLSASPPGVAAPRGTP